MSWWTDHYLPKHYVFAPRCVISDRLCRNASRQPLVVEMYPALAPGPRGAEGAAGGMGEDGVSYISGLLGSVLKGLV